MGGTNLRSHRESITVQAGAEDLYDIGCDITRTGQWSPVCTSCWWDDPAEAGQIGAWFTGNNELPHRTWQTRSQGVVAERGREFAWIVGGNLAHWGFTLTPAPAGTTLTESWDFLPDGIATFQEKFGDNALTEIADRTQQALDGIPITLTATKRIAESTDASDSSHDQVARAGRPARAAVQHMVSGHDELRPGWPATGYRPGHAVGLTE